MTGGRTISTRPPTGPVCGFLRNGIKPEMFNSLDYFIATRSFVTTADADSQGARFPGPDEPVLTGYHLLRQLRIPP